MREIERIDRAVALGHRHQRLAVDFDLDHRLGDIDLLAARVVPPLDRGAIALDVEELRQRAERIARQDHEPRLGAVIGIAARLALLDGAQQFFEPRVVLVELDAVPLQQRQQVRLARLLADHDGARRCRRSRA